MKKIKVALVMGTRPEAIKLAPVIYQLKNHPFMIPLVINTGQHLEMMDQMLRVFQIQEDYHLDLMVHNQTLTQFTSKALAALEPIISKEMPDVVLTQGDTTTAFTASLVAFYHKIKVGHIEAGLRTNNRYAPFPEEINRKLIAPLSEWSFAPTQDAVKNLLDEKICPKSIHCVGNTVVDALHHIINTTEDKSNHTVAEGTKTILMTAHRRENFGEGFDHICDAICRIAQEHAHVRIVYPVHLNPNIRDVAYEKLQSLPNVDLVDPMNYIDFVHLMKKAHMVITDSGGIQEEAPVFGKPVLVLRHVTERPEGVRAGVAKLVGTDRELIVEETKRLLNDADYYQSMSQSGSLYGDGTSSSQIIKILENHFLQCCNN